MTCLVPDCKNPAKLRLLCRACYCQFRLVVKRGQTTWEELLGFGLAGPSQPRGLKPGVSRPRTDRNLAMTALAKYKTPPPVTRDTRIADSGLGVRARKVARKVGAETIGDLAEVPAWSLRAVLGCGETTEAEILKLLEAVV